MEGISVQEMKALENKKLGEGLSIFDLMNDVGRVCAQIIQQKLGTGNRIVIFCGPGNNGGDGYATANYLKEKNDVRIIVVKEPKTEPARKCHEKVKDLVVKHAVDADIVVDAILGFGAALPLKGEIRAYAKKINSMKAKKIAIDIPTGIDADTGEADGDSVKVDATICLHKAKKGLIKAGKEISGELWIADIGI
ncbi:NAD(P)H-hydrate epimerase [Candidatus Micrarchaeota archaeon]|nr:NAD(P)H-hydrate epimerase [Candidatus Micrarchaeota archaeon]